MVISGKKHISQLSGIGRQMPFTMVAFGIGAAGMCGIPPVAGFISKWFLCLGSVQSGHLVFLVVILVSSLLDVIYFFPIVKTAFFDRPDVVEGVSTIPATWSETSKPQYLFMVVPLTVTAIFSIAFCLFPGTFYILDLAEMAVNNLYP